MKRATILLIGLAFVFFANTVVNAATFEGKLIKEVQFVSGPGAEKYW